jgi:hypothetical protein
LSINDPNKLKTLMRELYVEALSTENIEWVMDINVSVIIQNPENYWGHGWF